MLSDLPLFRQVRPWLFATAWVAAVSGGYAQSEDFRFYVREYRVTGSTKLTPVEIQETVYPYLGPARTAEDVEQARKALEKAFLAKGFSTVSVLIPQQDPSYGVIRFEVSEGKVGRLRVLGATHSLPSRIRAEVPSLAEGNVPDFGRVRREIMALNQGADRTVVPKLRRGAEPGTVDVDLEVKESSPLHGSLELNNRYSADTTRLRLNGSISYGNLFQRGHHAGLGFQIAPENLDDAESYNGHYQVRLTETFSLAAQGSIQNSDISTVGGANVVGKGDTIGLRGTFDLPPHENFRHTFTLGLDRKHLEETTYIFGDTLLTLPAPITYYPISANYSATRLGKRNFTEGNLSVTLNLRSFGSDDEAFNEKRYNSRGSFIYLRGDLSHTHDLPGDSQLFGKIQGQFAGGPLINSEQFSGGGLGTVRGYLESTALGDNGIFGTFEFRSPSLIGVEDETGRRKNEWRFHAFIDGGVLGIYDHLPGQEASNEFASIGLGTRFRLVDHFNGSVDLALPLIDQGRTEAYDPALTFRGWADF